MAANIMQLRKMKVYHTLQDKRKIVGEAYTQPKLIKSTAQQYNVQPAQIHHWKATFFLAGIEDEQAAAVDTSTKNKTLHKGRDMVITQQQWTHLFDYFEWLHGNGCIVSVRLLAIELHHLDPAYLTEPQRVLDRWIRRFLARKHIVS